MNDRRSVQEVSPFFVIGNPRSGTTLLRLMLNRHEKIVVPPECGFSVWLSSEFSDSDFSSQDVRMKFISQVVQSRKFETWGLGESEINHFVQSQQVMRYRDIVLSIYILYGLKNGRSPLLVGDKNNYYIKHLDTLDRLFDQPKYVFISRDGRDVACSYRALQTIQAGSKYSPTLPDRMDEIAAEWVQNNAGVIAYLEKFPERCMLIRYEDLINSPERELRRACNFFGVDYRPTMLSYYEGNDEPREFLAWKEKVMQPPDRENSGMYRRLLSHDEIRIFEEIAKDTLNYFGYD